MKIPSKLLEQTAISTESKIQEHNLYIMKKTTHEEQLSQRLRTHNERFEITVNFLTGYNGIFNVTEKSIKVYFTRCINDVDFKMNTILREFTKLKA